jgi:Kef-type K+ transport system membrane component KefB
VLVLEDLEHAIQGDCLRQLDTGGAVALAAVIALIFAGIGAGLAIAGTPIIDEKAFSAIVFMVALTTLVPPLLVWRLQGKRSFSL